MTMLSSELLRPCCSFSFCVLAVNYGGVGEVSYRECVDLTIEGGSEGTVRATEHVPFLVVPGGSKYDAS